MKRSLVVLGLALFVACWFVPAAVGKTPRALPDNFHPTAASGDMIWGDDSDDSSSLYVINARTGYTGDSSDLNVPSGTTVYPTSVANSKLLVGEVEAQNADPAATPEPFFIIGPHRRYKVIDTRTINWTSRCHEQFSPLTVDAAGDVTFIDLHLSQSPTLSYRCVVDKPATKLIRVSPSGVEKSLWFPVKYKQWLNRNGKIIMRGNTVAVSEESTSRPRVAVLDVKRRHVIGEFKPIVPPDNLGFADTHSLVTTGLGPRLGLTRAVRTTLTGRHPHLVYKASGNDNVAICGRRLGVVTGADRPELNVLSAGGHTVWHRAPNLEYLSVSVVCSSSWMAYAGNNYAEMGDPDYQEGEVSGLLNLRKLR